MVQHFYWRYLSLQMFSFSPQSIKIVFTSDWFLWGWLGQFFSFLPWCFNFSTLPEPAPAKETIAQLVIIIWSSILITPMLFLFHAPFPLQDWSSAEERKLQQALKHSQLKPTAPSLLFLSQVKPLILLFSSQGRHYHSLSVIDDGRELVACGGLYTLTSCISWRSGQDGWTHHAYLRSYKDIWLPCISYQCHFQPREVWPCSCGDARWRQDHHHWRQ